MSFGHKTVRPFEKTNLGKNTLLLYAENPRMKDEHISQLKSGLVVIHNVLLDASGARRFYGHVRSVPAQDHER